MATAFYYPRVPQELIDEIFYRAVASPIKTMADVECLLRLRPAYFFLSGINERLLPTRDLSITFKIKTQGLGATGSRSTSIEDFSFADDVFKYRVADVTLASATVVHHSFHEVGAEMALLVKWLTDYTKPLLVDLDTNTSNQLIRQSMRRQIGEKTGIQVSTATTAWVRELP